MARKIAVADCETDPFKLGRVNIRPFLWGFYDGDTYEEFTQTIEFIKYIYDKNIILYAHNGGKFDWHFIKDYIDPFSDISIINGRISKFKIGKCEFRDSYNILPTSLAAYQKTKIDYNIFEEDERYKKKNWDRITSYLHDDCTDLYAYVMAFVERYGRNLTLAGAAMKQWQKISGREPPHDDGALYEFFKKYYYGGRCQSFYHGIFERPFEMVDINSAYPYAMLYQHPIGLEIDQISYADWQCLSDEEKGPCFLTVRAISGGAFPFRGPDRSLYYPDDNEIRTYHITGWELMAAIDTVTVEVVDVEEIYQFIGHTDFKDYILHFYNERKIAKENGDKLGDIFSKLFMNALYGKFASNPEEYGNFQVIPPDVLDANGEIRDENDILWEFVGEFGENHLARSDLLQSEMRYYNIATSASITGFVRAFLWRAICKSETPLYCDTDSIAAVSVDNVPNGFGKELGQWEKEGSFIKGAFAGRKLYAMEYAEPIKNKKGELVTHKIACKGVRLEAADIIKVAKGEIVVYEPDKPTFSIHRKPAIVNRTVKMVKKELIYV